MRACSYCGQDVSDKQTVCPKCKRPITAPDESAFPTLKRGKNAQTEAERRAQAALAPDDPAAELVKLESAQYKDDRSHKRFAAVAYTGILFFLPMRVCADREYGVFHANQGLLLFIGMALGILLNYFIGASAVGSTICAAYFGGLLYLMILGAIRGLQGKMVPLPIIGGIRILKP